MVGNSEREVELRGQWQGGSVVVVLTERRSSRPEGDVRQELARFKRFHVGMAWCDRQHSPNVIGLAASPRRGVWLRQKPQRLIIAQDACVTLLPSLSQSCKSLDT